MNLGSGKRPKPTIWIRSSRRDLLSFPKKVRIKMGYALWVAQEGGKHPDAKPMRGFGGAGVLEVITDFDRDTYRAIYTAKFAEVI